MPLYWITANNAATTWTGATTTTWTDTTSTNTLFYVTDSTSITAPIIWYDNVTWPNLQTAILCSGSRRVYTEALWAGLLHQSRGPHIPDFQHADRLASPAVHVPAAAVEREGLEREQRRQIKDRAQAILLAHLTPEQKDTLERLGWFVVEGERSRQRYRIRASSASGNIDVLERDLFNDKVLYRLCAHCDLNQIPLHDHLLAQKLMLEGDESEFLRIANRHAR